MRAWTLPIMVLMLALVLGGCGQKGALYRDSQGESMASGPDASADESDRNENRD